MQAKPKVNQDRGGVQCPFGGRGDAAFFCVMDGHGPRGEVISDFCMRTLAAALNRHPDLSRNTEKGTYLSEDEFSFLKLKFPHFLRLKNFFALSFLFVDFKKSPKVACPSCFQSHAAM